MLRVWPGSTGGEAATLGHGDIVLPLAQFEPVLALHCMCTIMHTQHMHGHVYTHMSFLPHAHTLYAHFPDSVVLEISAAYEAE